MDNQNKIDYDFPFAKFDNLFSKVKQYYEDKGLENYNAFYLSTSFNHIPSSRTVLLKSFSNHGFIFYTNLKSKKAKDIAGNPNVAMLFYWPELKVQVRIHGVASLVSNEEADAYFATRPYLSKIGAWASLQSSEMKSMEDFNKSVASYTFKYKHLVPRPPNWSGFIIKPHYFEFWKEGLFRMHTREVYEKLDETSWQEKLLYP